MNYLNFILLALCIIGMYFAYLYGRKTKQFRWNEYFLLIITPILCCLSLAYFYGIKIIYFFISSAFIGFVLEYLIGFVYHKTLNKRLWTYGKYNLGGYTSFLTFPLWGVAGVVFWLLSQSIGL